MSKKFKKIIIFGTFDGIHLGHKAFLREASRQADLIAAVLPKDLTVLSLKGYMPIYTEDQRKTMLEELGIVDIYFGDSEMHSWNIIADISPDAILLGYDQEEIEKSLEKYYFSQNPKIPVLYAEPYKENIYKNSLINKR